MAESTLPAVRLNAPLARRIGLAGALARVREALQAVRRYAPVEARRNKVLYAGWPLIILGTLPLSAVIAAAVDIPVGQAMSGALAAWATVGLPLTAVLFGAVAGAGLRGSAEEADAALPLSPSQRAFGALAAATAGFLGNSALVGALIAATSQDARGLVLGLAALENWESVAVYIAATAGITVYSVAWLLTTSFAAAYAASHAVLGGVAALVGGALLLLPVGAGIALFLNHAPQLAMPFLAAAVASTAASAAAAALALAQSAPAAARSTRVSWAKLALLGLLPLSGSLGAWPALWSAARLVQSRLEPVWSYWAITDTSSSQREDRRAGLLSGVGGRLVQETAAGRVVLLPGSAPALGELVRHGHDGFERVYSAFRDRDGRVWAEVAAARQEGQPTVRTVWTGAGGGPLSRYMTLPPDMGLRVHDGRAVVDTDLYSFGDAAPAQFVALDPAKPPVLKRQ